MSQENVESVRRAHENFNRAPLNLRGNGTTLREAADRCSTSFGALRGQVTPSYRPSHTLPSATVSAALAVLWSDRASGARPLRARFVPRFVLTIAAIALEYSDAGEPWESIGIALNLAIWPAFVAEVVIMLRGRS